MRKPRAFLQLALLAAIANAFAVPSLAADAHGRKIGELARHMAPYIARCLIKRQPGFVESWLRTLPGSEIEHRLVRSKEVDFMACFGNANGESTNWKAVHNIPMMRAGLVRALLQAKRNQIPETMPTVSSVAWYSPPQGEAALQRSSPEILANEISFCLAAKNWQKVKSIVLAVDPDIEQRMFIVAWAEESAKKRESAIVNQRISEIIPDLAGCTPAELRLTLNQTRIRSLLEETAYHVTYGHVQVNGVSSTLARAS